MGILGQFQNLIGQGLNPIQPPPPRQPAPGPVAAGNMAAFLGALPTMDWCSANSPAQAAAAAARIPAPGANVVSRLFGFNQVGGRWTIPDWFARLWGGPPGPIGMGVLAFIHGPLRIMDWAFTVPIGMGGCSSGKAAPFIVAKSVMGFCNRWLGAHFDPIERGITYAENYVCPSVTVTFSECIGAYGHGQISRTDAIGWGRANGVCDYATTLQLDAAEWHYPPSQLVEQRWRGIIGSDLSLCQALRWHGFMSQKDCDDYVNTLRPLWGPGEIYDALHRLRPGAVAQNLVYQQADANADLLKLGYTQQQVDRMLYLSAVPLDLRHALQPFYYGEVSKQTVIGALLDHGFTQQTVQSLLPFLELEKTRRGQELIGAPGASNIASRYAKAELPAGAASQLLSAWGLDEGQIGSALSVADGERQEEERAAGIAFVHARVLSGELSVPAAGVELGGFGIDAGAVRYLQQVWSLEVATTRKPGSPSDFCRWTTQGLMSVEEFTQRLQLQGYSPADTARIVRLCGLTEEQKRQKEASANAEKRLKYQQQQREKEAKLQEARRKAELASRSKEHIAQIKADADVAKAEVKERLAEAKLDAKTMTAGDRARAALAKAREALAAKRVAAAAAAAAAGAKVAGKPAKIPPAPKPAKPAKPLSLTTQLGSPTQAVGTAPAVGSDETAPPAEIGAPPTAADDNAAVGGAGGDTGQPLE